MIDVKDVLGFYDRKLHRVYTQGEAEALFGANLYRTGGPCEGKGARLQEMRTALSYKEIVTRYGTPSGSDHWIKDFKKWNHSEPGSPVLACRKGCMDQLDW